MPSATDPTIPIAPAPPADAPDADERLQILRLLESGDLTADEASDLLDAIDAEAAAPPQRPQAAEATAADAGSDRPHTRTSHASHASGPARLRIRISDTTSSLARVNIAVPLGFLDAGYRLARRVAPGRIPAVEELHQRVSSGFRGHLVDVNEAGDRVEILIE